MNQSTHEKLKNFASLFTWSSKHPSDMERFYKFTAEAYKQGDTNISSDEFKTIFKDLYQENLNEETVFDFYAKYETAIEVLRIYNNDRL